MTQPFIFLFPIILNIYRPNQSFAAFNYPLFHPSNSIPLPYYSLSLTPSTSISISPVPSVFPHLPSSVSMFQHGPSLNYIAASFSDNQGNPRLLLKPSFANISSILSSACYVHLQAWSVSTFHIG